VPLSAAWVRQTLALLLVHPRSQPAAKRARLRPCRRGRALRVAPQLRVLAARAADVARRQQVDPLRVALARVVVVTWERQVCVHRPGQAAVLARLRLDAAPARAADPA
jgi:hypothetical protein